MGYYETTPPELLDFPKLTQEELDWVDGRFQKYMMYETRGKKRKAWFSCCHRAETLDIKRVETPALRTARAAGHNDIIECPFCGEAVKVKCIGRCREGKTLTEYIPVVFLRASESGKTVWAQAYWTMRNPVNDPLGVTLFAWTSVYRFRRGEARQWQNYGKPREKEKKEWITEPFRSSGLYSGFEPYAVHG